MEDETDSTIDERWLRETALRLTVSLDPSNVDAQGYADRLRMYVKQIAFPGITPRSDLGTLLRAPKQDKWLTVGAIEQPQTFAWGSIHSVKGREFPSVVVVLPQKLLPDDKGLNVLDHWHQDTPSAPRRVLYVGASRAQQLLILAVHAVHRDRVATLLKRDNVLYDLV